MTGRRGDIMTVGDRLAELWRDNRDMKDQIAMLQMCVTENEAEQKILSAKPMGLLLNAALKTEQERP